MKVIALKIPFQYVTLEKEAKIIMNTIDVDFVYRKTKICIEIQPVCRGMPHIASAFYVLIGLLQTSAFRFSTQHHTASLSLPSDETVKIQTREVKLMENWHSPFIGLNTEKCFFNNCVDPLPPS